LTGIVPAGGTFAGGGALPVGGELAGTAKTAGHPLHRTFFPASWSGTTNGFLQPGHVMRIGIAEAFDPDGGR
jgi:hypothetical protein